VLVVTTHCYLPISFAQVKVREVATVFELGKLYSRLLASVLDPTHNVPIQLSVVNKNSDAMIRLSHNDR